MSTTKDTGSRRRIAILIGLGRVIDVQGPAVQGALRFGLEFARLLAFLATHVVCCNVWRSRVDSAFSAFFPIMSE
jgi:hypothetical protein